MTFRVDFVTQIWHPFNSLRNNQQTRCLRALWWCSLLRRTERNLSRKEYPLGIFVICRYSNIYHYILCYYIRWHGPLHPEFSVFHPPSITIIICEILYLFYNTVVNHITFTDFRKDVLYLYIFIKFYNFIILYFSHVDMQSELTQFHLCMLCVLLLSPIFIYMVEINIIY